MESNTTIDLFEFKSLTWQSVFKQIGIDCHNKQLDFKENFERLLQSIWDNRYEYVPSDMLEYTSKESSQAFFDVTAQYIKPKNYLGTINFVYDSEYYQFNIHPKIFYLEKYNYKPNEVNAMQLHIAWWLSKSNYFSLPSYLSVGSLEEISNILDVYVLLFSEFALETLSLNTYKYYIGTQDDLYTVKGSIDFNQYVNNFSKGNKHKLSCVYDDFSEDNTFNRLIKYVSKFLLHYTKVKQTRRNLEEILFILNEVSDMEMTLDDCDKVSLNPIFTEYQVILDFCKLFLTSSITYSGGEGHRVFTLLIPSERLFERFVCQMCKQIELEQFDTVVTKRPGRKYLADRVSEVETTQTAFKVINDIILKFQDDSHILIDTKYKLLSNNAQDNNAINQSDIYQMIGYAISSGVTDIALVYPQRIKNELKINHHFKVDDLLAVNKNIKIQPWLVDIIAEEGLNLQFKGSSLEEFFSDLERRITSELKQLVEKLKMKSREQ